MVYAGLDIILLIQVDFFNSGETFFLTCLTRSSLPDSNISAQLVHGINVYQMWAGLWAGCCCLGIKM